MKRLFIAIVICTMLLMVLSISWAATNLNSSRSNIYRMVFDPRLVSQAQGDAMVRELEKLGAADEAKLKHGSRTISGGSASTELG